MPGQIHIQSLPFSGYITRESGEEGKLELDVNAPLSDDDVDEEEDDYENIKKIIKKTKSNEKSPVK